LKARFAALIQQQSVGRIVSSPQKHEQAKTMKNAFKQSPKQAVLKSRMPPSWCLNDKPFELI
jgi:hypothetical protein